MIPTPAGRKTKRRMTTEYALPKIAASGRRSKVAAQGVDPMTRGAAHAPPELSAAAEDLRAFDAAFAVGLEPWQLEQFGEACRREHGRYVHRLACICVPRGVGKSFGCAAEGCRHLLFHPAPALIVGTALDVAGALVIMNHAKGILDRIMARLPELAREVDFLKDEIRIRSTGSRWVIRSRDHTAVRGLHPTLVLYDEVGWAKDSDLFETLIASQNGVPDGLMLVTSTVGRRQAGPLWLIRELATGHESPV
jgi:phage terminase large subunit-like protein